MSFLLFTMGILSYIFLKFYEFYNPIEGAKNFRGGDLAEETTKSENSL